MESPLVFVGIIEKTSPHFAREEDKSGEQSAWVRVIEAFKGAKPDQVFELRNTISSCFGGFTAGREQLFYLFPGEKAGTWIAHACHRTRRIDEAAEDLRFLRGLPASARGNVVSGGVELFEDDPVKGFHKIRDVSGVPVRAVSPEASYETVTDAQGLYEFRELRPGTYKIQIDTPKGTTLYFPIVYGKDPSGKSRIGPRDETELKVTEDSGNGIDFLLSPDTRITGRVLDPEGNPMKNVCLELDPLQGAAKRWSWISDCTKPDGTYLLDRVPAGSYRIVANREGRMSAAAPFGQLYYPGVREAAKARVLTVVLGQHVEGVDFQIPELAKRIELSGRLTFANGVPIVDQSVDFRADELYQQSGRTDADGNFKFQVLAGRPGRLTSQLSVSRESAAACPQFRASIEPNAYGTDLESTPFPVAGNADMQLIEVTFPFPSCDAWIKERAWLKERFKF